MGKYTMSFKETTFGKCCNHDPKLPLCENEEQYERPMSGKLRPAEIRKIYFRVQVKCSGSLSYII